MDYLDDVAINADLTVTGALTLSGLASQSYTSVLVESSGLVAKRDLAASLLPTGTEGQMLYNNAGTWTATSNVAWNDTTNRVDIVGSTSGLTIGGDIVLARSAANTLKLEDSFIVSSGAAVPLVLQTSSPSPWAFQITRSDVGSTISAYNAGGSWYFGEGLSATTFTSRITTGTSPLYVSSTTVCANLNADLLDGQHGSYYQNASNLSSGTVPNARLPQPLQTTSLITDVSVASGAWYTIATNLGSRAFAKFLIVDQSSGLHQGIEFIASHHFGTNSSNLITVTQNSWYSSGGPVRYIRIKEGGTSDGAMLQIYLEAATTSMRIYCMENIHTINGWVMTASFVPDGTNPGGVNNFANLTNVAAQVDLDQGPAHINGDLYLGGATTQYKAIHAGNYNTYAPTLTGTGASGSWGISVTGSSASCTGNAASATYASNVTTAAAAAATLYLGMYTATTGNIPTYVSTECIWSPYSAILSVSGTISASVQLISTTATGTAPLVVSSTTAVANLNSDLLDGQHGSYYQDAGNINAGTLAVNRGGTGLASYTTGDLIYASGSTTLSKLAKPAGVNHGVLVYNNASSSVSWATGSAVSGRTAVPQYDANGGYWGITDHIGSITSPVSSVNANDVTAKANLFLPVSVGSTIAGSMYFNYSTNTLYVHNGTAWKSVTLT